jgi:chromosomal replication initiator protein
MAEEVLDRLQPAPERKESSITHIQSQVAKFFEVSVSDLRSSTRAARVAWPRQVAIHLSRELTSASLQEIGRAFGNRNHATVLHACKRVSERISRSPEDDHNLRELTAALAHSGADRSS